ncbi:Rapid inducer of G2/M progression in oocytes A [Fasciola hepatica]|uniref:Rapid inducer of G2/M progression in oocytes A n=1 Tax=Fasciola hepatica TaxID=6192 RepID=A0A4E0RGW8_FASHE|nr:Rapid inducer of G2/M progression in oocytes A [Fasciola hepatica]
MDWSLSWFEAISPHVIRGRKRCIAEISETVVHRKNVRRTPCFTVYEKCRSPVYGQTKQNVLDNIASPRFIRNGNKAPSIEMAENNFIKAYVVRSVEMTEYFHLLEKDEVIKKFLEHDICFNYADKYLLACVFAYFKRCNFKLQEYNRMNFFSCLYIAHDMEEDDEDYKYEIFPWALGSFWREKIPAFIQRKEMIWARMNYRAIVSYQCCKEVSKWPTFCKRLQLISIAPDHPIWKRNRASVHGLAMRTYLKSDETSLPRGPSRPPRKCDLCGDQKGLLKRKSPSSREPKVDLFRLPDLSVGDSAFASATEEDATTLSNVTELRATSDVEDLISLDYHSEDNWLSQETFISASNRCSFLSREE